MDDAAGDAVGDAVDVGAVAFDVVIPSCGRDTLAVVLDAVLDGTGPVPGRVVVVDDRPDPAAPILPAALRARVVVARSFGNGAAAARNVGWQLASSPWVAFLDDDVRPAPDWRARLAADLARHAASPSVAGVQGRIHVPLPSGRAPTDRERNTAGLATAKWPTADFAFRRGALASVGGFDERFRRAYREDADLAARLIGAGWELRVGDRVTEHPVRPAPWWASIAAQRGNAADALLRAEHGPAWRERCGVPTGRRTRHGAVTAAAAAAAVAAAAGRRRTSAGFAALWLLGTAEFAGSRIAPGPRSRREIAAMAVTSVAIPPWRR